MKVAEVASRFTSIKQFLYAIGKMGFELIEKVASKLCFLTCVSSSTIAAIWSHMLFDRFE